MRLQEFLYLFGTITREMGVSCVSIPSFICWLHCIVRLFNSAYKVNQSPQMNLYKHINISFFPLGMKFIYIRTQLVLLQKKRRDASFCILIHFCKLCTCLLYICYFAWARIRIDYLSTFYKQSNSASQIFI